jgi:hypothetical protein
MVMSSSLQASVLLIFIRLINKGKSRVEDLTLVHAMGEITRHLRRSLEAAEGLEHQEGASEATQEALKKELDFQATAREALEALVKKVRSFAGSDWISGDAGSC